MTMQWFAVHLCLHCAERKPGECTEPRCPVWLHQITGEFGNEHSVIPMTDEQFRALEAGREFERGLS